MRPHGRKYGMLMMAIAQLETLHGYDCLTDEEAQSIADRATPYFLDHSSTLLFQ